MSKESTKQCPRCGNTHLGLLYSLNLKYCSDCHIYMRWELDAGQVPLLSPSSHAGHEQ